MVGLSAGHLDHKVHPRNHQAVLKKAKLHMLAAQSRGGIIFPAELLPKRYEPLLRDVFRGWQLAHFSGHQLQFFVW
jgi:hypothetical protein